MSKVGASMVLQTVDVDRDGAQDIFVSFFQNMHFFYSKGKDGPIIGERSDEKIGRPTGLNLGISSIGDFDRDGSLDIFSIYLDDKNERYVTIIYSIDATRIAPPYWKIVGRFNNFPAVVDGNYTHVANDIAVVDFDNDGYPDVSFASHETLHHITNRLGMCRASRFLAVVLKGGGGRLFGGGVAMVNAYGIGSFLWLHAVDRRGKERVIRRNSASRGRTSASRWWGRRNSART